jgi:hypothetical protein
MASQQIDDKIAKFFSLELLTAFYQRKLLCAVKRIFEKTQTDPSRQKFNGAKKPFYAYLKGKGIQQEP